MNALADLWLDDHSPTLRQMAVDDLAAGNVGGFLCKARGCEYHLRIVFMNHSVLLRLGLYEKALLDAFISTRTNNSAWSVGDLRYLFDLADRERLLAAGDPLPPGERFTLYRGVAGRGPARRVRGLSWTLSIELAQWFAARPPDFRHDPAIYQVTVAREHVLAYTNERKEEEFIVLLPAHAKPARVGNHNLMRGAA